MESIKLWARNGEAVRQAIGLDEIVHEVQEAGVRTQEATNANDAIVHAAFLYSPPARRGGRGWLAAAGL